MSTPKPTTSDKIIASFSGHETFPFRYTWLKKGVDAVRENLTIFADDSATITLGVGKNMVRSIHHWCQAAGLIEGDGVDADNRILRMLRRYGSSIGSLQQMLTERLHGFGRLASSVRMNLERRYLSLN